MLPTTQERADFAERMSVGESTEAGDVIGAGSSGNRKSQSGDRIIGVISDSAGFIGNDKEGLDKATHPVVGLLGQIRTKVATESGTIKKGDFLSLSATAGVARKATSGGEVLGTALEDFPSAGSGQVGGVGKIMVLVRPGWYMPDVAMTDQGQVSSTNESQIADLGLPLIASPANNNPASPAPSGSLSDLANRVTKLEERVTASGSAAVSPDLPAGEAGIASSSATSRNDNEIADLNSKFLTLNSKIASLEADLALFASGSAVLSQSPAASSAAELGLDKLDAKDVAITRTLSVGGRTTLGDVGITGKMNIGLLSIEGLSENGFATINTTSGPLKLQSDSVNGVDILNGKVVISTNGDIKTQGEITVKKVNVDTEDVAGASLGTATIVDGETIVSVQTSALTDKSKVFVQAVDSPVATAVKKTGADTFDIKIPAAVNNDLRLNWWIVN